MSTTDYLQPTRTWAHQDQLPRLPIPPLEDTCRRYLTVLKELQDEREHENTKRAVVAFLQGDGPRAQEMLLEYAKYKDRYAICYTPHTMLVIWVRFWHSYIEDFWYERLHDGSSFRCP
jgi:Choline/Carnitine o-acyltransferase